MAPIHDAKGKADSLEQHGSLMSQGRDIVVIGTSAGGIEAMQVIVSGLPADLRASLFVVIHIGADSPGAIPNILQRAGDLPAANAKDSEQIKPGRIYVAPPDHHLILEGSGRLRVTRGPKENRFRPAIDPLCRSAALAFGRRVLGIILTGGLDDGTGGLRAVKACGGTAIVQDPESALAPSMPLSALEHVAVDYCVPLEKIQPLLVQLISTPAEAKPTTLIAEQMETEVDIAKGVNPIEAGIMKWGEPSIYACPDCHGVLLERKDESNLRFRCHTGHAFTLESLLADFTERTEQALWSAVRSLEETMLLMRRLAACLSSDHKDSMADSVLKKADWTAQHVNAIREILLAQEKLNGKEIESLSK